MSDRAIIFVDGNNWYHSLVAAGVSSPGQLDFRKISRKLLGPRRWIGTRYYVGQVSQDARPALYADQRRFLSFLRSTDARISVHLGRIEERYVENAAAKELRRFLQTLTVRIETRVYRALMDIVDRHRKTVVWTEKAVDVMLAVDMVLLAERGEYDAAYLLSADGDYTPAVRATRELGKSVYVASAARGAQLAAAADSFIPLRLDSFRDCF